MLRIYFLISLVIFYLSSLYGQGIEKNDVFIDINSIGHKEIIRDVVISKDRTTLITAGFDKTIKYWDVSSGLLINQISGQINVGQKGKIFAMALSPDGKYIAVGGFFGNESGFQGPETGAIRIYDYFTARYLFSLKGHYNSVFNLAFSADSRFLVSGSADYNVIFWDIAKRDTVRILRGHSRYVYGADIHYPWAVSSSEDGQVILWNLMNGKIEKISKEHTDLPYRVKFSPDGSQIVSGGDDNKIIVYDKKLNVLQKIDNGTRPVAFCFSPDGKRLVVGTQVQPNNCNVYEKRGVTWNYLTAYKKYDNPVFATCFIDNNTICTAGGSGQDIAIWKVDQPNNPLRIITGVGQEALSAYLHGNELFYSFQFTDNNGLSLLQNRFLIKEKKIENRLNDSIIHFYNRSAANRGVFYQMNNYQISSKDVRNEYFGSQSNARLQVKYDQMLFKEIESSIYSHHCYTFTPDNLILSGGNNGKLFCYNLKGERIADFVGHVGIINSISISDDGTKAVTTSNDQTIRIWDITGLKALNETEGFINFDDLSDYDKKFLNKEYPDLDAKSPDYIEQVYKRFVRDSIPEFGSMGFFRTKLKFADIHKFDTAIKRRLLEQFPDIDFNRQETVRELYYYFRKNDGDQLSNEFIDVKKIFPIASVFISKNDEWIIWSDDGYYSCSKMGNRYVGYHVNKGQDLNAKFYPFEQFDLLFHRPDIINQRLSIIDTPLNKLLYDAYLKRLSKMNTTPDKLVFNIEVPALEFMNGDSIPRISKTDRVELKLRMSDSLNYLNRFFVWVNDVPVYGKNGKAIALPDKHIFLDSLMLFLTEGENKIQASVLNSHGVESYKETFYVKFLPKVSAKPDFYFIGIGVSDYKRIRKLNGVDNDIRDLLRTYKVRTDRFFDNFIIDTILNKSVSKNELGRIKKLLEGTKANDVVLLYYSGHGDLDRMNNYYLYTYDIDPKNIGEFGINYEELENLLDSIPARKKLLLVNACRSGEYDQDMATFEKMNSTFTNIRRSIGAMVISSSAGNQDAFTGLKEYNDHSAFGESILQIFNTKQPMTINELQEKLNTRISILTHYKQTPTIRSPNLEFNYRIW